MKLISLLILIGALAIPAGASAAVRHYEGTVVSVDRATKTFRLHDSERSTVRIEVTGSTRFERIAGFSGLRRGQTDIEAATAATTDVPCGTCGC